MAKINFEAKTERELLILTAQAANETREQLKKLNGRVGKTESNIAKIIGVGTGVAFVISVAVALIGVFT
jgi:hypothetical protein